MLDKNFKKELDGQIIEYIKGLEGIDLSQQADFLFFLKNFWFPYASKDHQQIFLLKYKQDNTAQYSDSFRWIEENREKVDSHLIHLQRPIDAKKFLANIGCALKTGLTLRYSPSGPAEE